MSVFDITMNSYNIQNLEQTTFMHVYKSAA